MDPINKVENFSLQQLRELAIAMQNWRSPETDPVLLRHLSGMQFAIHFRGLYDWGVSPERWERLRRSRSEWTIEDRVFDDLRIAAVDDYKNRGLWILRALQNLKLYDQGVRL